MWQWNLWEYSEKIHILNHLPVACPKILAPFKMSNAVAIVIFAIVIFPLSTAKQLILLQIEIGYLVQQTN